MVRYARARLKPSSSTTVIIRTSPIARRTAKAVSNMISMTDLRYDTSQYPGGTFYDNYAHAKALVGTSPIIRVSLVLDAGWDGDQRLTLTSATVATEHSPTRSRRSRQPRRPRSARRVQAIIGITKVSTSPTGDVNEPDDDPAAGQQRHLPDR